MFDTMQIAKKIKMARIGKNMTQMQLADAMGISYQAVSNWERGNSMPDISKLEDLCSTLGLSVADLLGMERKTTAAVEKALQEEELTQEEVVELAPILPPAKVKEEAKKSNQGRKKWDIGALAGIAPFLDEEFFDEIVNDVEVESLVELGCVAPFLSEEQLDILARRAPKSDIPGIVSLAPFLSEETLDHLVRQCDSEVELELVHSLAPFLSEETLDILVEKLLEKGNAKGLSGLYPFLSDEALRKIARRLMAQGDMEELKQAAVFL